VQNSLLFASNRRLLLSDTARNRMRSLTSVDLEY